MIYGQKKSMKNAEKKKTLVAKSFPQENWSLGWRPVTECRPELKDIPLLAWRTECERAPTLSSYRQKIEQMASKIIPSVPSLAKICKFLKKRTKDTIKKFRPPMPLTNCISEFMKCQNHPHSISTITSFLYETDNYARQRNRI
jgi:hypothetical protein